MNLIALVSNANCTKVIVVVVFAVNELFPFASKSHLCLGTEKGTFFGEGSHVSAAKCQS